MFLTIPHQESKAQFLKDIKVEVIEQIIPMQVIQSVIDDQGVEEQRRCKLPTYLVVLLCIAMNLYAQEAIEYVLAKLLRVPRLLQGVGIEGLAKKSAISLARYRLGSKVLEQVFKRGVHPIADSETCGAFAFGYRLVALDGVILDLLDTVDNASYFGRSSGQYGDSAFPQAQVAYLSECGTHVIFDAGIWPYGYSEDQACQRLLRSVNSEMLVLYDAGLHSFDMLSRIEAQGATFLTRLPKGVKPQMIESLNDGSYLAKLKITNKSKKAKSTVIRVRVITYQLDDPQRPSYGQVFRLITNLLDPDLYPIIDLICLYHERWEIEISIDEIETHQRLPKRPLRSRLPLGVIQEFYAMLLAHFVVRSILLQAANTHFIDPDRLSFVNSLRLIRDFLPLFQLTHTDSDVDLWNHLWTEITFFLLPPRSNRINPRVVKRKQSKFTCKRLKHHHWPQPTMSFRQAIRLTV